MDTATNLVLLLVEGFLYFVVMAALFRVRHRFGIGLLFCALGAMHFLETYLAAVFYLTFPGGVMLSPGSIVLFSGKLVMLLLIYIREDASTVRQPIYGLLIGNFLMVGLVWLMRHHIAGGVAASSFAFMDSIGGLMLWGTMLLFIDSILIILLYERTAKAFAGRHAAHIAICAAAILTFDQIGFFAVLRFFLGLPWQVFFGGLVAKLSAAVFFGVLAALYLRYVEPATRRQAGQAKLADVFDALTYRQRYETLLRQTGRDGLTGLYDRGRFENEGYEAVSSAIEARRPISLLVVDLDHFKSFNDRFGHSTGDEVLRLSAAAIQAAVRQSDRVYRYGGEEFVVLCDGLGGQAAMVIAERLRRAVSTIATPTVPERVTASVGLATAPDEGLDLARLFAVADARLYAAKEQGRDRVVGRAEQNLPSGGEADAVLRRPA